MGAEILLSLAILVIGAKIFGEIAERLRVPPIAGEIFAGIIAGPVLHLVFYDSMLTEIANIGAVFAVFLLGMSMRLEKGYSYSGSLLAVSGALLSFALGFFAASYIFSSIAVGLVVGVALLSTSLPAALDSLRAAGEYKTNVQKIITSSGLADGTISVAAVSLLAVLFSGAGPLAGLLVFVLAVLLLASLTLTGAANRLLSTIRFIKDEQVFVALPLAAVFLAAFISQKLWLTGVAGAFLAGVAMSRSQLTETAIMPKIKTIGHGLFIPFFFAYSAVNLELQSTTVYVLAALLLLAGLLGKFIGFALSSGFFGFSGREARSIGLAMLPRGEFSIIVMQLALAIGVITIPVYTALLLFVLFSVALTPILLRISMR